MNMFHRGWAEYVSQRVDWKKKRIHFMFKGIQNKLFKSNADEDRPQASECLPVC